MTAMYISNPDLFARWNQSLRHSLNSNRFLEIVSDDFPGFHLDFAQRRVAQM
jgi:hypothetical protein